MVAGWVKNALEPIAHTSLAEQGATHTHSASDKAETTMIRQYPREGV